MNMIGTGQFEVKADTNEDLVKKLVGTWEKKSLKAARAGGVSTLALALAACGGEDNTPFAQADIDAAVAPLNDQITSLTSAKEAADSALADALEAQATAEANAATANTDRATAEANLATANATVERLTAEASDAADELSAAINERDAAQASLVTANAELATANTSLAAANTALGEVRTDLGLSTTATAQDMINAITTLENTASANGEAATAANASLASLRTDLGLAADATTQDMIDAITALETAASDAATARDAATESLANIAVDLGLASGASEADIIGAIDVLQAAVAAANPATVTSYEVSATDIVTANAATANGTSGVVSLAMVGSPESATVSINSDGITYGSVIITTGDTNATISASGNANNTLTVVGDGNNSISTGAGNDTITVYGSGNNTVTVGAGDDTVTTGAGNDNIVFGSGALDANDTVNAGDGIDTVTISGDNNVIAAQLTGVENLVFNGTSASITAAALANISSIEGSAATTEITINGAGSVDLSSLTLVGGLAAVTVSAGVSATIPGALLSSMGTITNSGTIVTDEAGATLLSAAGITGVTTAAGSVTLSEAVSSDLAAESAYTYTVTSTAEGAYDAAQVTSQAAQIASGTGDGATIALTDGVDVDQLTAIQTNSVLSAPVALTDTGAALLAGVAGTAEVQNVVLSGNGATGQVTFLGTAVANSANADTLATTEGRIVTDKANIIATWNAANPDARIADIAAGAGTSVDITFETTAGDVADLATATSAGVTFTTTAGNTTVAGAQTDLFNEDYVASVTITDALSIAQAGALFASGGSLAAAVTASATSTTDAAVLTTPSYTISDTAANITAAIASGAVTNATSVTATTAFSVADASTVTTALGTALTGYSLSDTAAAIAATTNAIRNGAEDITATGNASAAQARKIEGASNSGDTTYSIQDTPVNLYAASTAVLEGATAVTLPAITTEVSVQQANKIAAYIATTEDFVLSDTAANLTSADGLALIASHNVDVKSSDALTMAQATTLSTADGGSSVTYEANPDITDTAVNILAAITPTETDALGNSEAQTTAAAAAEALIDTVITTNSKTVTATGNVTVAEAGTLVTAGIGNAGIKYSLADTAANLAANTGGVVNSGNVNATTVTTAATAAEAKTLAGFSNNTSTISVDVSDTATGLAAVIALDNNGAANSNDSGTAALIAAGTITVTGAATILEAKDIVALNTARDAAGSSTSAYSIEDVTTAFPADDSVAADVSLLSGATSVVLTGTGANIKTYAEAAATDGLYAHVDSYKINVALAGIEADHDNDAAYYANAASITVTDADLTVANLVTADGHVDATASKALMVFADVSDTPAQLVAAAADAAETALVGKATSVTIDDSASTISVANVDTISGIVNGTLVIDTDVTDTTANLVAGTSHFVNLTGTNSDVSASDAATVAQYTTLLTAITDANISGLDAEHLDVNISDTVENVQGASVAVLDSLGSTTSDNSITLTAGSTVSLTVAQIAVLDDTGADGSLDDINAFGGSDATYQIVDTIDNIINGMTNATTLGDDLTNATSILATAGTTVPQGYLAHVKTLVAAGNFDTTNSVYSVSGEAATLAHADYNSVVSNATAVTVTDAASLTEATNVLADNASATLTSLEDDWGDLFTITDGVAAYAANAEAAVAAANAVELRETGSIDPLEVAEYTAIRALVGDSVTLTYNLADTAANTAAGTAAVAGASVIAPTGALSVAEYNAVTAAMATDATLTYSLSDTATNLATLSKAVLDGAATLTQTANTSATIAEGTFLNTSTTAIVLTVEDTAANLAAYQAVSGQDLSADFNQVSATTTFTAAEAAAVSSETSIDTVEAVTGSAIANGIALSDTADNLADATSAFTSADSVTVTGAETVSNVAQVAAAYGANNANVNASTALAAMTYSISDTQALVIDALENENAILGNATSVSMGGTALTLGQVNGTGTYYASGDTAYLGTLPSGVTGLGFIIVDDVATATAGGGLYDSTDLQENNVSDTAANIAAGSVAILGSVDNVNITDTATVAEFNGMVANALPLNTVAGVTGSATDLAAADLDYNSLTLSSVVVTGGAITGAEAAAIVTAGGAYANMTYDLSDTSANTAVNAGAVVANAASVTYTDTLNAADAGTAYGSNPNLTVTISDSTANFATAGLFTAASARNAGQDDDVAAINLATSVSLTASQTVTVAQAEALLAVSGFDGVYALSDSSANLAAADASVLADATAVAATDAATVAEATILTALSNFATTTANNVTYSDVTITDTAANIAAADASLLDNVALITFSSAAATDDDVTAAQAQALSVLDANAAVVGLDLTADTADVVDTSANITASANADGVGAADNVTATDVVSAATAQAIETLNGDASYDITDTSTNLTTASAAVKAGADDVVVSNSVNIALGSIINTAYSGATSLAYATLTDTYDNVVDSNNSTVVGNATSIDLTDDMTVAEATSFLASATGAKLTGGYDVSDSVVNIVNASENDSFSNAILTNANAVTLTGSVDMNVAGAAIVTALSNFSGAYTMTDDAATLAGAAASLVNGATTATFTMDSSSDETIDVSGYTSTVVVDVTTTQTGDVITLADAATFATVSQSVDLANTNTALTFDYGYLGTGGSFTSSTVVTQVIQVSYTDSGSNNGSFIINGAVDARVEDTMLITGTDGADTITIDDSDGGFGLDANSGVTPYVYGGFGDDTITGSALGDTLLGGDGADTVSGAGGNDTLNGGAGDDTLNGGAGNDTLTGGAGDDTLDGGAGTDAYVFSDTNGSDTIAFVTADDDLDFTGVTAAGTLAKSAVANDGVGDDSIGALDAVNTTVYVISSDATDLDGAGTDDTIADFTSMANVAAFLDAGVTANGTADETHYFVINDGSDDDAAYVYKFVDDGGNAAVDADELTLIGTVNVSTNADITTTEVAIA